MWQLAGILAVPLIEIALFVTVGGWIGLWATLAIVILTAVAGVAIIRLRGAQTLEELRQAARTGRNPLGQMAHSALIGLAGVLLILPGFLTDTLGLLLLLPPVRRLVMQAFAGNAPIYTSDGPGRRGADVIDAEYFEIDDAPYDAPPPDRAPPARRRH